VRLPERPVRSGGLWLVMCLLAVGCVMAQPASREGDHASAKEVPPPAKLTKQYPLGQRRLCCRGSGPRKGAAPPGPVATRARVETYSSPWPLIAGAVAALVAAVSCGWVLGRRQPRVSPERAELAAQPRAPVEVDNTQGEQAIALPASAVPLTPAPRTHFSPPARVLGYACLRPDGDGAELEVRSQAMAIENYCLRRGWTLLKVVRDVETPTGKSLARPGLGYALDRIAEGQASCLMVSKLERLTRSVVELAALFEWFKEAEARLVVLDQRLDTFSLTGRMTAETIVAVGTWEREKLSGRARRGASAAPWTGRPAVGQIPALHERVVALRKRGMTLQAIADTLNGEGVPTLRGGVKWRPSSVQSALGYKRPKRSGASLLPPSRPQPPSAGGSREGAK
jgi:DNA invertase Pin-like site-specific DNA recombinase